MPQAIVRPDDEPTLLFSGDNCRQRGVNIDLNCVSIPSVDGKQHASLFQSDQVTWLHDAMLLR